MTPKWLLLLIVVTLASCGPSETPKNIKQPISPEAQKSNEQYRLLTDPTRDNNSYLQQLRTNMKIVDGFLVLEDWLMLGMTLLPQNSGWVVSCGVSGLSVSFGNGVSGDVSDGSGSIENEAKIVLALGPVPKERCRELAPLIGKEIQHILGER